MLASAASVPCAVGPLATAACGARTTLVGGEEGAIDAIAVVDDDPRRPPLPRSDAGPPLARPDAAPPAEAGSGDGSAPPRPALPPIDASTGDVRIPCPPGAPQRAYLVAESGAFYAYDPPSGSIARVGTIACPARPTSSPFTMTIGEGAAFVLFTDGDLYRVDLASLSCTRTAFRSGQLGFPGNVGVATAVRDGELRLVVYGCIREGRASCEETLASSDFVRFELATIGSVTPDPVMGYPADVKVDGHGRLFAMSAAGTLIAVDTESGRVLGRDETGLAGSAWALLAWRDEIYAFTKEVGLVHRYDLATKKATPLGQVGDKIVGAGAAPCMP